MRAEELVTSQAPRTNPCSVALSPPFFTGKARGVRRTPVVSGDTEGLHYKGATSSYWLKKAG